MKEWGKTITHTRLMRPTSVASVLVGLVVGLSAVACIVGALPCPGNCTGRSHGVCDEATGVCQCRCPNEHRCFCGPKCSKECSPYYGWDQIDCHGGRWAGNWTGDDDGAATGASGRLALRDNPWYVRQCVCPKGWEGADCSICSEDASCWRENDLYPAVPNSTCDRSVYIYTKKRLACNITTPEMAQLLGANASVTVECHLPPPSLTPGNATGPRVGNCSMILFNRRTGPPYVFSCDMYECKVSYDARGNQKLECPRSACRCSDWCVPFVQEIVDQMVGPSLLECAPNRVCTFTQDELGAFIPQLDLVCKAGECYNTTFTPILPDDPVLTKAEAIIVVCCGGVTIAGIVIALALWFEHKHVQRTRHNPEEAKDPALVSFSGVGCWLREKRGGRWARRVIVEGVSGEARPGQLTAILGSSGAGKTTVLDILAGRKNTGVISGDIYVNARPIWMLPRRALAYVTQDDVMLGTLTVREHLAYAAMLRLPGSVSKQARLARIETIMRELGLTDIADSRIGTSEARGISGGERKRVNIATELLAHPKILFLDEATTGLDAANAFQLVSLLKRIAQTHGTTIIMSIHQPRSNIFALFDSLILLAHTKMVYSGPANKVIEYFEARGHCAPQLYNPADFLIDVLQSREATEALLRDGPAPAEEQQAAASEESTSLLETATGPATSVSIAPEPTDSVKLGVADEAPMKMLNDDDDDEFVTSYATQLCCLAKRTAINVLRDPFLLRINYALAISVGLLLGFLYWKMTLDLQHGGIQNRMGIMFFIVCLFGFTSLTSVDTFFSER
jgi:ABC-type multidrug transport system ATPase subunit